MLFEMSEPSLNVSAKTHHNRMAVSSNAASKILNAQMSKEMTKLQDLYEESKQGSSLNTIDNQRRKDGPAGFAFERSSSAKTLKTAFMKKHSQSPGRVVGTA